MFALEVVGLYFLKLELFEYFVNLSDPFSLSFKLRSLSFKLR